MRLFMTLALIAAIWGLPLYALIYNRLYPSYESGLGVAFAWFIGLALGVILAPILGLVAARWPALRVHPGPAAVAWLLLLAGAPFANRGDLSVF